MSDEDQPKFALADRVSWDVGSDRYAGYVTTVMPSFILVMVDTGYTSPSRHLEKFTLRRDGEYRLLGCKFGTLSLGGEAYWDPSF